MKKIFLRVLIFSIFIIANSCEKPSQKKFEIDPQVGFFISQFDISDFRKQFGNDLIIQLGNAKTQVFYYMGIPETYIVTPVVDLKNSEVGKFYSLIDKSKHFKSVFVKTSSYNFKNGDGEISYFGFGVTNKVVFQIRKTKIIKIEETLPEITVKSNTVGSNAESSCTGKCYKQAKDACDADPDCKLACDLLASCVGSMAVACFIHCLLK